jgi:type VI secretion system secreted protein VgrG
MAAQRKISLKTPLGADQLLLRAATITERLGQPFEIDVDLLSPDEGVDFDSLLGKDLTLSIKLDGGSERHFHAFIAGFAQIGRLGRYVTYRAHAVPWLWFLSRCADCYIFQNKSVPDIIKEVFREHGFTDLKDTLTKTYRVRDYCVQYRETDLNFVQRLMEEEGIYYFFEHASGSHKLVLADSYSGHKAYSGYESIEYFPPSNNAQREVDHIHDWFLARNIQSGKYVATDYDFTKPRASLQTQYVQQRGVPKSDYEVYDYPGKYLTTGEGDHYVQARLESLQAGYETVRGVGNARGLSVGSLFKLTGYPRNDQNREYLITSAIHHLDVGEYESGKAARSEDYSCSFEAMASAEPFRSPGTAFKTRVSGPHTATVVGPEGEEIYTDKYGRVKVKFHWDRDPNRNESSSCWVRVSQIWAGKNWGWMSIPRVGQEVVIDFLEGDPDQPLITGRVYNQDNMPPYDLPANKTQSGFKSRSTMSGGPDNFNEIRFEDKKGAEQLYIHAEKNQDNMVEADATHTVGHDRTKAIGNDETTTVGNNRTETVGNCEVITIGVNRTENVGANETIGIGASRSITVGSSETATVALQRTHTVGVNETITIGAAQEVTIGALQMVTVGAAQVVSVGAAQQISVGANQSTDVGLNQSMDVGANQSFKVGGNRSADVGKNDNLKVANNLVIDAGDAITIKTGSASITMKKDGTILIKGKDIKVQGSGKVNVKASGNVAIKGSKIGEN